MDTKSDPIASGLANGRAMAAFLGAGIGAFAMGAFVLLNEAGVFAAPALYGPAGGLSGRAVFATVAWLIALGRASFPMGGPRGGTGTRVAAHLCADRDRGSGHISASVGDLLSRSPCPGFRDFV